MLIFISAIVVNLILQNHDAICILLKLQPPKLVSSPDTQTPIYFSNRAGLILTCLGDGFPPVSTNWLDADNFKPLNDLTSLREKLKNESLFFPPFRPEHFSSQIHSSKYRCSLTNSLGTYVSSPFNIRAVIDGRLQVYVQGGNENVIDGNPMILSCEVKPSLYTDFVKVIAWKKVDHFGYEDEITPDSRYYVSPSGSLVISSVQGELLYLCTVRNSLNGVTKTSSPFLIRSQADGKNLAPRLINSGPISIRTKVGASIDLCCLVAGQSPLTFRWMRNYGAGFVTINDSKGSFILSGPLFAVNDVDPSHNGSYRCEVSNEFGRTRVDYIVHVDMIPSVVIQPEKKVVTVGESIQLNCVTSADPSQLTWLKNGNVYKDRYSHSRNRNKILIKNAKLSDQGIYQCLVKQHGDEALASSYITFEGSSPHLSHRFQTKSLPPGSSVSLKCSAIGNPPPSITWFVDDQKAMRSMKDISYNRNPKIFNKNMNIDDGRMSIEHFETENRISGLKEIFSHYNITRLKVSDSGFYTCQSSNHLGVVSYTSRLNVYGPIYVKEMKEKVLAAGGIAHISCFFAGFPVNSIRWRKNSEDIEKLNRKFRGRYDVLSNGTLKIIGVDKELDAGEFMCIISNKDGEHASGIVKTKVMRPPVIRPFTFGSDLSKGERISVPCNVISGDLPIHIEWMKDLKPISYQLNISQTREKFFSYLMFEELNQIHSGEYMCQASNAASATTYSAHLAVKVPPTWKKPPKSYVSILLNEDVTLSCSMEGYPAPRIKWFRGSGPVKSPIKFDHKFSMLDDKSLTIRKANGSDATEYLCEGDNGVGTKISATTRLVVNIPPLVSAIMTSMIVAEGSLAVLKCQIFGEKPIEIQWRKGNDVLQQNSSTIQTLVTTEKKSLARNATHQLIAKLLIQAVELKDSGEYFCKALNQYGTDYNRIQLFVRARPATPHDFIVEEIGSRFLRLTWSPGSSNVTVTRFVVQYKKSTGLSWNESKDNYNFTVMAPTSGATLTKLSPVTNYDIRILASNEIGFSLPSEPLSVLTLPEAPSGSPTNLSAVPLTSTSILVRWEPPLRNLQNGEIQGYKLSVVLQPQTHRSHSNISNVSVKEEYKREAQVKSLIPNSHYRITVQAYNSAGIGPKSPFVTVYTPEGAPDSPPLNFKCRTLSAHSIHLHWAPPPPSRSNGRIQGYKVIYQSFEDNIQGKKAEIKKTSNEETTLHGLASFTNYTIQVLAFTRGGEGILSSESHCVTEQDVPGKPSDIKVAAAGPKKIMISWLAPQEPNGLIIKYTISWRINDQKSIEEKIFSSSAITESIDGQFSTLIANLRFNRRYWFWVTASTIAGTGEPSRMENIVLTNEYPARIVSFPVTRSAKIGEAVNLPCQVVGLPFPKVVWLKGNVIYNYYENRVFRNESLLFPSIQEPDEAKYTCQAENGNGKDEINHEITIRRKPNKVPIFLGYVTYSSVQIHWEYPFELKSPLRGFWLYYKKLSNEKKVGSGNDWTVLKFRAEVTSYTLEKLECGSTYRFMIFGVNVVGKSKPSEVLEVKTSGSKPKIPNLTEIIKGNETVLCVNLKKWPDGGCPIERTLLEFKTQDGRNWQRVYKGSYVSKDFYLPVLPRLLYLVKISIINGAGSVVKTYSVNSSREFFTHYDETIQLEEGQESSKYQWTDPHVIVPIISGLVCTCALLVCVGVACKRRLKNKEEWKFFSTATQSSWVPSNQNSGKIREQAYPSTSEAPNHPESVYATYSSSKPSAMTIRDPTVRFETFAQRENYAHAPPGFYPFTSSKNEIVRVTRLPSKGSLMNEKDEDAINDTRFSEFSHDYSTPYESFTPSKTETIRLSGVDFQLRTLTSNQGKANKGVEYYH